MAAKSTVTLTLDGPRITSDKFVRAVNSFVELLGEVSRQVTGARQPIQWTVTVKAGSVNLAFAADAPSVVRAVATGMSLVERRAARPKYFSDIALQRARELSTLADGKALTHTRVRVQRKTINLSPETAAHVDTILAAHIKDYGTIEGRLEMISVRGGAHFNIYDAFTDEPVRCLVGPGQLTEAMGAFGRRVAVTGLIRYRQATGEPLSIEVEEMAVFPSKGELPTADDVYGILRQVE